MHIYYWTYEADCYCVPCAEARFTVAALFDGTARDSEGHAPYPQGFPDTEEWERGIECGACGAVCVERATDL